MPIFSLYCKRGVSLLLIYRNVEQLDSMSAWLVGEELLHFVALQFCANQFAKSHRSSANLQYHPCPTYTRHPKVRNNPLMGPASLPSSLSVPRQAHPAANSLQSLLTRHSVLFAGQLPPVPARGRGKPWKHRCEQDTGVDMRTLGHEAPQGVLDPRAHRCSLVRL